MADKDLRRRLMYNSRSVLARQFAEHSALSSVAHLLHNANPILNSILVTAICQSILRKVDKSTQTLATSQAKRQNIRYSKLQNTRYSKRQNIRYSSVST